MAGDWIKVEHATTHKPEVTRAAEMLGISRREAMGLFLDFWVWLDNNLSGFCPDSVRNVSKKSLDEFLHCPGFSGVLESIGWGSFDSDAWTLHITNAARHNGNTAKTRASDSKRKAEERDKFRTHSGQIPDTTRTREEKRREEITPVVQEQSVAPAPAPKLKASVSVHGTRLDPLWVLPADWAEWSLAERSDWTIADVERVALVFRDHWHAKAGKEARRTDWLATWRNWIRRERRDYRSRPTGFPDRKTETIDNLTGKHRGRTVNGSAERMGGATVLTLPGGVREQGDDDVEGRGPGGGKGAVG